ncbi:MAG: chaperone modulator CbpM [Chitinophagaceae bacterium]
MEKKDLIPAAEICSHYQVEYSFINELNEHELIELNVMEETSYLSTDHLADLERFIRLHYDLDINIEGLEAVNHLLKQIHAMQNQIQTLENKLHLYEE